MNRQFATGYFGVPGKQGGKVHVVLNNKPLCGQALPPKSEFQWCCHGIDFVALECGRCRQIVKLDIPTAWHMDGSQRWLRLDGAEVIYSRGLMGPETNENLPLHRGWVAYAPPQKNGTRTYLGYFPTRWRRGGRSRMKVPIKYKSARAAMRALNQAHPI